MYILDTFLRGGPSFYLLHETLRAVKRTTMVRRALLVNTTPGKGASQESRTCILDSILSGADLALILPSEIMGTARGVT